MPRKTTDEKPSGFAALELDSRLLESLSDLGYEEPTPIQRESIPPLVEGRDLIGQAATGTGKTAAFALPLLHRLAQSDSGRLHPSALVLVPTRELAMQVAEAIHRYGHAISASVLPIYGGQSYTQQLRGLKRGVDVVVATPGRALDHIQRGTLKLQTIETVVLDEADEMLDMGFADDIESILNETPAERQTVLFSATLPPRINAIAKRHLKDPVQITIARETVASDEVPRVRQTAYIVQRAYKAAALGRVLDLEIPTSALVFCRMRTEVDDLTEKLNFRGYRAEALHGGMSQDQRTRVIKKLRGGGADLVIATDVAARGLDIEQLSHVINFDVPSSPEAYVHRIGRVGRAGREGVAITLAEPREHRLLRSFEHATKQRIEVAQVPTISDLQAQRLEVTRAALHETLLEGELDGFRAVVESLAEEFDPIEVALAAVKLAHEATVPNTEHEDIPAPRVYDDPDVVRRGPRKGPGDKGRAPRERKPGMSRIYVGVGRAARVRPQDLVGAIANESGINAREIGAIHIADQFSLVELPEDVVEQVISSMRNARIMGRRATVRRDHRETK